MIRTIAGTILFRMADGIVVDIGGLGYLVSTPSRYDLVVGQQVSLWTYHHIKEDGQALYGFETVEELGLFEQLLSVSSIGPKLGMAILSVATPTDLIGAVNADNVGFFQSISGVGKKSALKIIIELKGRLTGQVSTSVPSGGLALNDALTSLGYAPVEIQRVIQRVPVGLNDEAQVAWALRELA
ncbi:MAG: Holliday junction branch migration protein RuvA [Patescibacteria group bacterium]